MFMRIKIVENGPYLVGASIPLYDEVIEKVDGVLKIVRKKQYDTSSHVKNGYYALCRCGESSQAPFCDGIHVKIDFDGTETAGHSMYRERAELVDEGESIFLYDDNRCAYARVCHRQKGDTWTLTDKSYNPEDKKEAIEGASLCPAGRLTMLDAEGRPSEIQYEPHIAVIQDPLESVSAALYVRGNIELIGVDGISYEVRNRYALCRCGQSYTKPFCDANHVSAKFNDGKGKTHIK